MADVDYVYGPYTSIQEALNKIPLKARTIGITIGIIENSKIVEYWFKNGITDSDLILKQNNNDLEFITEQDIEELFR